MQATTNETVGFMTPLAHWRKMNGLRRTYTNVVLAIEPIFRPIEIEVKVGFGLRKSRAFDMTRDGFTLLAMGFTGKKAPQFKLKYIAQFNAMEEQLKGGAVQSQPITPP